MKKYVILFLFALLCGCASSDPQPKAATYPYGLSEKEWNSLSIRDQTRLRRDFYFYEKGSTNYVNPKLEVEGKTEPKNAYME